MHVAVVGAGAVGTLTAYFLHRQGCQVTVFDRNDGPACETSFANGAQLSYSFADALADPQLLPKLPSILLGADPAFKIHGLLNPEVMAWGLSFLRQCTISRRDANTRELLTLAQESADLMAPLICQESQTVHYRRAGKLVLLDKFEDREMRRRIDIKRRAGFEVELVTRQKAHELEPSLEDWQWQPNSAVYAPGDSVADAHLFSTHLVEHLERQNVTFVFGQDVSGIDVQNNTVNVTFGEQDCAFDALVLATGDGAQRLLSRHGIRLPILAMAGYSWTFPATETSHRMSITASPQRTVFSRLGDSVRIAGFADINLPTTHQANRVGQLKQISKAIAPKSADFESDSAQPWHGYRAVTPNSQPLLGATNLPGVYTNLGHGMLGWTLAAASGKHVADLVCRVDR